MTYQLETRRDSSVAFVVEYYSKTRGQFSRSRFVNELSARDYYEEKLERGYRPKLFKETSTVELKELVWY